MNKNKIAITICKNKKNFEYTSLIKSVIFNI